MKLRIVSCELRSNRPRLGARTVWAALLGLLPLSCSGREVAQPAARPSILLVTLDTTRADAIGPDAKGVETPAFNALAARGRRFTQAYATVPETLPSHASMMTGLYPGGHGIHENARFLANAHPVVAERLQQSGYRTAAFVSSFVLARRFGLARGFEVYDDELPAGRQERTAPETTDRAIALMARASDKPLFLWVHYFDPHAPYTPPSPFAERFAGSPYQGEVAAMDEQLGRLVQAFEQRAEDRRAIVIAGDHGEGLGDHGEQLHGNLLYQSTMHVPLLIVAPELAAGVDSTPVSTRRIFHTLLDRAGVEARDSLRTPPKEVVVGEAMKPYLSYGWQPQIMAVETNRKAIFAGTTEVYDLGADPGETRDLGSGANLSAPMRKSLDDYPVPSIETAAAPVNLSDEARRNLASLGYVSAGAAPVVRKDAPRPIDMVKLFDVMDRASTLFVQERYQDAIPLFTAVLAADAYNLAAALRLATSHSLLGQDAQARAAFKKAATIAPKSPDVRVYLALHYARGKDWQQAVPMLEKIVAETPEKQPAVEALALVRVRQGKLAMERGETDAAIRAFEDARRLRPTGFAYDLDLGVLYLDARRLPEARDALDRVTARDPAYPMALFKRAQVSVLMREPDASARIERARQHADALTRDLIASERLFQNR